MTSHLLTRSFALALAASIILSRAPLAGADESSSSSSQSSSSESSSSVEGSSSSSLGPATGQESIVIEQNSPIATQGRWFLLKPNNTSIKIGSDEYTLSDLPTGNYVLSALPPEGTNATILMYKGETLLKTLDRPQVSFTLEPGDSLRFTIQYKLTRTGTVTVDSTPAGIPYRLQNPNAQIVKGVTPGSFLNTPEGQYAVWFEPEGCPAPKPQSGVLVKDSRLGFSIAIDCPTLKTQAVAPELMERNVSLTLGGQTVVFIDVPLNAWFATHAFNVAKLGIITGDRDAEGKYVGIFRPGDPVILAELAKIAHVVAGIDETALPDTPINPLAQGAWFSRFISSAEHLDWLLFTDPALDLTRPATRAEVMVTLLQALDIPLRWPKGTLFSDVTRRTPHAAAIETAAFDGIVEGEKDDGGAPTGKFNPDQPINRAELAKIINIVMATYRGTTVSEKASGEKSSKPLSQREE